MHSIVQNHGEPDILSAIEGPIRKMAEIVYEWNDQQLTRLELPPLEWRIIRTLPRISDSYQTVQTQDIACTHCHKSGGLVTLEWGDDATDKLPHRELCPVCSKDCECAYVTS
jgi:hypothetical protein